MPPVALLQQLGFLAGTFVWEDRELLELGLSPELQQQIAAVEERMLAAAARAVMDSLRLLPPPTIVTN